MARVLCITDRDGYAFARRAEAIERFAPDDMAIERFNYGYGNLRHVPFSSYDVVFCLLPRQAEEIREVIEITKANVPLIVSWNSGPGRVGYDIGELIDIADYIVVNNYPAWTDAIRRFPHFRGCHISNGVDLETFRCKVPIAERPNRVLWIAGESKANDDYDVKGFHTIMAPVAEVLRSSGVEVGVRIVMPGEEMTADEMCDWYQTGRVFAVTSTSEGTPNTMLEAAACGCAIVAFPVGNVSELIRHQRNGFIVERKSTWPWNWFLMGCKDAMRNAEAYSAAMLQTIVQWNWAWPYRAAFFYALFARAAKGELRTLPNFSYIDTSVEEIAT